MFRELIEPLWKGGVPFFSGIYMTLLAFHVIGKKPRTDEKTAQSHKRNGDLLKICGPLLIIFGIYMFFSSLHRAIQSDISTWQTATSLDGTCTVEMPGIPVSKDVAGSGVIEIIEVTVPKTKDSVCLYQLLVTDLPELNTPPQEKLLNFRENLVKRLKLELVSDRQIEYDGIPGREFEMIIKDKGYYKGRVFLKDKRIYLVFGITGNAKVDMEQRERVLNSIKLKTRSD